MTRRLESLFDRYRRRGDARALGRVFDHAAPEILNVAMHLARHPAEAEDLVQETFLTAIEKAESWDCERPLVPWLVGILKNHARAARRREARRRRPGTRPGTESLPEPWLDVAWSGAVAEAVEGLDDPYREVLVLLLRHGRTPAEIALLLNRPPATVRSQIHRGLDRLRRNLPSDARSRTLAVLPMGVGLAGVRTHVVAHAVSLGATTSLTTGSLLLTGGLVMMKKSTMSVVLLLGLLAVGAGLFYVGDMDRRDSEGTRTDRRLPAHPGQEVAGPSPTSDPTLVGHADARAPEVERVPSREGDGTAAPTAWPPSLSIPDDKGSVAGTLRLTDGTPLAGLRVALWGSPSIAAVTDAHGRFHIHADWPHDRSLYLRMDVGDQPDWVGYILSTDIAMKPGELVMRDVVLDRGIDVESVVVDDRTNEALKGVTVTLRREGVTAGQGSAGFLFTDEQGRFAFSYVPRTTITLQLELEGYQPALRVIDLRTQAWPERWTLRAGRGLVLRFLRLPEGAVGTEVKCALERRDGVTSFVDQERPIRPDGTIHLDAPEPGTYWLTLFQSSHLPRLEQKVVVGEGELESVVIGLDPGARVEGTMHDADGQPLAGRRVRIEGSAGRPTTDEEGHFAISWVPAGTRDVKLRAGEAWVRAGTVQVPEEGVTHARLQVLGTSTLRGAVEVGGEPVRVRAGEIWIRDSEQGQLVASVRTGVGGRFELPLLLAGRYEAHFHTSEGVPRVLPVVVGNAEVVDLGTVTLQPYLSVPVRFVLPEDWPEGKTVFVSAWHPDEIHLPLSLDVGGQRWRLSTWIEDDEEGRTWVRGLVPGRVRLGFHGDGASSKYVELDVQPDMTTPIEVRLEDASE